MLLAVRRSSDCFTVWNSLLFFFPFDSFQGSVIGVGDPCWHLRGPTEPGFEYELRSLSWSINLLQIQIWATRVRSPLLMISSKTTPGKKKNRYTKTHQLCLIRSIQKVMFGLNGGVQPPAYLSVSDGRDAALHWDTEMINNPKAALLIWLGS